MKVLVNGIEKELEIIGANGVEWTEDALDIANNDDFTCNDDIGKYECGEDAYERAVHYLEELEETYDLETGYYDHEA